MDRDFTYVEYLAHAISLLIEAPSARPPDRQVSEGDPLSPVAPYCVDNIGNGDRVRLIDMIEFVEKALGKKSIRNYLGLRKGDVPATWANADVFRNLTSYAPSTNIEEGVNKFVDWYFDFYGIKKR